MKKVFEKSIVTKKDLKKGQILKFVDLSFLKPRDGIRADKFNKVVGKKINKDLKAFTKLKFKYIEK